ncbi:MAG: DUF1924 domain-containing protein [Reinekea sp.]|jgi:hypothetical protein
MKNLGSTFLFTIIASASFAGQALDNQLELFAQQGATQADAERGRLFWITETAEGHACAQCHGEDVTQVGKHARTGKLIEPMAPSVNPSRLSDEKQMTKWLLRNCKWTLGRECSAQEKADVLTWLSQQ